VRVPTVNVNRGDPVTVIDSVNATVNDIVFPGIYVLLPGAVTDEIVGAVRSIVIGVVVSASLAGPVAEVTVPYTEFAKSFGIRVPSLQLDIVKVNVVPEAALIENTHPVAVPAFAKSLLATVLTFCESVSE
jgi:hypothetical protein